MGKNAAPLVGLRREIVTRRMIAGCTDPTAIAEHLLAHHPTTLDNVTDKVRAVRDDIRAIRELWQAIEDEGLLDGQVTLTEMQLSRVLQLTLEKLEDRANKLTIYEFRALAYVARALIRDVATLRGVGFRPPDGETVPPAKITVRLTGAGVEITEDGSAKMPETPETPAEEPPAPPTVN